MRFNFFRRSKTVFYNYHISIRVTLQIFKACSRKGMEGRQSILLYLFGAFRFILLPGMVYKHFYITDKKKKKTTVIEIPVTNNFKSSGGGEGYITV